VKVSVGLLVLKHVGDFLPMGLGAYGSYVSQINYMAPGKPPLRKFFLVFSHFLLEFHELRHLRRPEDFKATSFMHIKPASTTAHSSSNVLCRRKNVGCNKKANVAIYKVLGTLTVPNSALLLLND